LDCFNITFSSISDTDKAQLPIHTTETDADI
jgi:hypothetical protein